MKTKMKFLFKPAWWFTAGFLLLGTLSSAQMVKDTRSWSKTYSVSSETTLELENKYGTILIVPWKKDSVQVSAEIYLEAKNNSKLRKLKNDIWINSTATRTYVLVQTMIGEGNARIASELRTLSNTFSNNSKVEINYTVYLPEYLSLVLNNKFGDIYIDDIDGDVDISLSNGVLKANSFNGDATIELLFAKGSIRKLGTATMRMSYGELLLKHVDQLDYSGKSSTVEIDTAGIVKIDSRRDKINFNEVEYLYGNSSFTDVRIRDFIREADCDMKYGTLKIDKIEPEFSRIDITSDFTDITLYFPPESKYLLDIIHNEDVVLNLPRQNSEVKTLRTGDDFLSTEGFVGGNNTEKRLSIKAEHKCYINISIR